MKIIDYLCRKYHEIRYRRKFNPKPSWVDIRVLQKEINRCLAEVAENQLKLGDDKVILTPPYNLLKAELPKRNYKWRKKIK